MAGATFNGPQLRKTSLLSPRRTVATPAGVGIALVQEKECSVVRSLEGGSSAALSGVQIGDVVLTVDGRRVHGMRPDEIQERLMGEPGTRVLAGLSRGPEAGRVYVSLLRAAPVPAHSSYFPTQAPDARPQTPRSAAPLFQPMAPPLLKGPSPSRAAPFHRPPTPANGRTSPLLKPPLATGSTGRASPADGGVYVSPSPSVSRGSNTPTRIGQSPTRSGQSPTRSGQTPRVLAVGVPAPFLGIHLEQAHRGPPPPPTPTPFLSLSLPLSLGGPPR